MASSGSYNFAVTRDDLIKHAYMELGVLEESETPSADQTTEASEKLNMLVKTWAKKYNLHLLQDVVLFLVVDQQSYLLGDASTDAEWCAFNDYAQTTLSTAAASGAGTVTLTATTGFAASDRIGVVLDSGTIHWTTINGALAGSVATLTATLTGAAASGNVVFGYTNRIVRPLRVVRDSIYRRDIDDSDIPVELVAKTDYDLLTAKTQSGKIIKAAYQPFLTSGRLWTWPTADLATDVLRFTVERPVQDFDATTDNPDFPVEASVALYTNLAVMLAGPNGARGELPTLVPMAQQALDDWLDGDVENASVRFQPDLRR